jgi:hypothetical protein
MVGGFSSNYFSDEHAHAPFAATQNMETCNQFWSRDMKNYRSQTWFINPGQKRSKYHFCPFYF